VILILQEDAMPLPQVTLFVVRQLYKETQTL